MLFRDFLPPLIFFFFASSFISFTAYELWGIRKFKPKVYSIGLKLRISQEKWDDNLVSGHGTKETLSGCYKIISPEIIYFYHKQPIFSLRINTPFPLKGIIELKNNNVLAWGRTPLGTFILVCIWLIFWTIISGFIIFFESQNRGIGLLATLCGYVFALGLISFSFHLEKRRLLLVLEEIKQSLGVQKNNSLISTDKSFELRYSLWFALAVIAIMFVAVGVWKK